ncbi:MAG TPA: hypothetical protein DEE98_02175 [Elusimicrobia bacterium]|nr:MAG: hypothetical protein A2278_08295 [Elusimicrobia bacterium RIFOXYA12_FULL_49_49]OGS09841.1 MAG: hypothetical protein A2204_07285 [Elusimicrobia bacterium RIFOXYA1_FULL_47_7]OGS11072.1 MAG: hypothetical protein A2386_04445 [Elusimicrobia bacterium RIFOXYB1_FULL_48_9]OGS15935.1 MAG: hypothetical protein A2251_01970 [Elusimicrobia bacterium RIFOXYA2_FULL_47_53]OGS26383.1 MAG: hypothetical protein A2339_03300 [Elusimicrobia bacterium RIFOXYB12_FULL_50_12]OGS29103.1 MAG: hypothetical protein
MLSERASFRLRLLFLFILSVSPVLRFSWDLPSQTILHLLVPAALFFILNYYKPSFKLFPDGAIVLLFVTAAASIIGAQEKAAVRNDILALFDCLAAGYIFSFLDLESRKKILLAPVFAGVFFTAIMLFQFVKDPVGYFLWDRIHLEFIVNFSILAGYMALLFPISLFYLDEKEKAYGILPAVIFLGIILTKSRIAFIAASAVVLIYVFRHRRKYAVIAKIAVIFAVISLAGLTVLKISQQRLSQGEGIASNRIAWWNTSINMFLDNPVNGAGLGNFSNLYQVYRETISLNTIYAHNILLQTLADTGILGALGLLFMLFLYFRRAITSNPGELSFYAMLSAASLLVINLFDYSFHITAPLLLFWVIVFSGLRAEFTVRDKPLIPKVIQIALVVLFAIVILRPLFGAVFFQRGKYLLNAKDYAGAEKALKTSIIFDRMPSSTYSALAQLNFVKFTVSGNTLSLTEAVHFQKEALARFSKNAVYWSDLSWLYRVSGDMANAAASMRKAYENDRLNPVYIKNLEEYRKDNGTK